MSDEMQFCILQNGKTALDIAVEIGYSEIIQVLKNSQSKVRYTMLFIAKYTVDLLAFILSLPCDGPFNTDVTQA